tara:strand:+ start:251 stop:490 length:240 start_codon:yes stop_codon:yes gene_type:complete
MAICRFCNASEIIHGVDYGQRDAECTNDDCPGEVAKCGDCNKRLTFDNGKCTNGVQGLSGWATVAWYCNECEAAEQEVA